MRLLLIDDDAGVAAVYGGGLRRAGYAVDVAVTVAEGEALTARHRYDLYIIDQSLPDGSGTDLCRALRNDGIHAPILILSGFDATGDVVAALEAGADDFLAKPCPMAILIAHCSRMLSRQQPQNDVVLVGSLSIDLWRKRVSRDDREIDLTAKEYALVEYLGRRPGSVIPSSEIVEHLWDDSHPPGPGSLKALVSVVRHKLGRCGLPPVIHTMRNRGYVLTAEPHADLEDRGPSDSRTPAASYREPVAPGESISPPSDVE